MAFYHRHLPHWHPEGRCIFVTWRLHGSLPSGYLSRMRVEKRLQLAEEFRLAEALLDGAVEGPLWLKEPRLATIVVDVLRHFAAQSRMYDLHAYTVMANHIHVLLTPWRRLRIVTRRLKGSTARECNAILHRTGQAFWQDESFDHWVRDEGQFVRFKNYIERNPVKAGLVARPEDWPWSSASR
jgi:putative transposase